MLIFPTPLGKAHCPSVEMPSDLELGTYSGLQSRVRGQGWLNHTGTGWPTHKRYDGSAEVCQRPKPKLMPTLNCTSPRPGTMSGVDEAIINGLPAISVLLMQSEPLKAQCHKPQPLYLVHDFISLLGWLMEVAYHTSGEQATFRRHEPGRFCCAPLAGSSSGRLP